LNILDKNSRRGDCFAAGDGGDQMTVTTVAQPAPLAATVTTVAQQPAYVQAPIPQTTTVIAH